MSHQASLSCLFLTRCFLVVLALFSVASVSAQTAGFITTRPTCVPPTSTGVQDQVNYIQGADPVRLPNGDVAILVDAGQCCNGNWEAIFSLVYPGAGSFGVPRFNPIYGSNNFGNNNTNPKEHEAPFPSAIYNEGKWRIVYTSTFFPTTQSNRDRAARIDVDNLTFRAAQAQVTNQWIKPVSTSCKTLGSCSGEGSGVLATVVRHPNTDLYVYHPDGNYPSCASGWIRHKIGSNMSVLNPNGSDGCLSWQGQTLAPPYISDIARGADGKLYMLSRQDPNNIVDMIEWVSSGTASTIGLSWTKTGRKWSSPAHPSPPKIYSVWDGGYLKDADRQIIEPKVVVAQISDGSSFAEIVDASLGRWYLYYWADAGASLPPTWGSNATSCAFGGNHDVANCSVIAGWNWDPLVPNSPHFVDIYDGPKKIASAPANLYRGDLLAAGIGNGVHGFSWPVPLTLKDGLSHSITVKHGGTTTKLSNSPKSINCSSSVQARVIWVQPQQFAGFGPPGSLVIAGSAAGAPGAGVKLWYRDVLANGAWTTQAYMPVPDANNIWYHAIPNANYWRQYDIYVEYGGGKSLTCSYQGFNAPTNCP